MDTTTAIVILFLVFYPLILVCRTLNLCCKALKKYLRE